MARAKKHAAHQGEDGVIPVLSTGSWQELNEALSRVEDEHVCQALLNLELGGKRRKQFALRIQSRFQRLRGQRERRELLEKLGLPW